VATKADGLALGAEPAVVDEWVGPDGQAIFTLEIEDGRYRLYVTDDNGNAEVATQGPYHYDEAGHLVTSEDCCGGNNVFNWAYDHGTLDLAYASLDGVFLDGRFATEGRYRLETDGGGEESMLTLRFANLLDDVPEQLVAFQQAVQRGSGGTIDIVFESGYGGEEDTVLADIAAGAVDMGWWVPVRCRPSTPCWHRC
jgi:hypothetical protein